MLLRKLVAALCPLLLCLVLCLLYRWLDGVLGAGLFWSFLLKGLLLGVMLALIIPLAGLRCHSKGLQPWLYAGAALLAVTCAINIWKRPASFIPRCCFPSLP